MPGSRITFLDGLTAQPQALERVTAQVRRQLTGAALDRLRTARRPLLTGIGASYAALALPVEVLRAHGVPAQRVLASELGAGLRGFDTDLLIGVSQGGRSTETVAAFRAARGVPALAVLNVTDSPLGALAALAVGLGGEPDSAASTIGFTGTVVALDLIAGVIAGRDGDPWQGVGERIEAVRARTGEVVAALRARAARCVAVDCVASGASRVAAEEAALLLREVPRMPASASVTRNYLHGEMESAGNTLHLVFGAGREVELARSLSAAGHLTLLVTTARVEPGDSLGVVRLPECAPTLRAVLETVVAQELVAVLSVERDVPLDSFVFVNDDTKVGGAGTAAFEHAEPVPVA
ncbi:SIS domain-containing protein [Streptomyces sp. NPDC059070]|uniref:SIS domain-containing protein n=1 Tax=unclassified Streptomyces TaxID=2593676 RepID=UPI0034E2278E